MAKRITFSQLVSRVETGVITQAEVFDYFTHDASRSRPLDPAIALNESNVDLSGVELAARAAAHELGISASATASNNYIASLKGAPKPDGSIIADGDSWFRLPVIYQKTMIDWLQQDYPITNIAHQGDTLEDIIAAGEYVPYLTKGKVRILMLSAGGNDFLGGNFIACLNQFDVDHQDPSQAAYYLTDEFDNILKRCDYLYRALSQQVRTLSPKTTIIAHGYDRVYPWCNGIFIGNRMVFRGLEPCFRPKLCNAIVHLMINRFNGMLANLQKALPKFKYANLLGTLKEGDYFDEIHPKSAKAKVLVNKMAKYLDAVPLAAAGEKRRTKASAPRRRLAA